MNRPPSKPPAAPKPAAAPTDSVAQATLRAALAAHGRGLTLDAIIRVAYEVELERQNYSVVGTARALHVGRTTLYRRMAAYGIHFPEKRREPVR